MATRCSKNSQCPKDKICNPASERCVSKTGKIGRRLVAGARAPPPPPPPPPPRAPAAAVGKVVAFVMTGCSACEALKPDLIRAKARLEARGVPVLIVNISESIPPDVAYLDAQTEGYPTLYYLEPGSRSPIELDDFKNPLPTADDIVAFGLSGGKIGSSANGPSTSLYPEIKRCTTCGGPNNISPKVWGPSLWNFIHLLALSYPERPSQEDKARFKTFFTALRDVLPCTTCRRHYVQTLQTLNDAAMASRDALFDWTVVFHNKVSGSKGQAAAANARNWKRHYIDMIGRNST